MKATLSKSRYVRGLQCHKSLWLVTNKPELRQVSAAAQATFDQGHKVGELARDLFPGGVLIAFEGLSYDEQVRLTNEAMKSKKVIYEAAFKHNGIFIKADILRKVKLGWELYEVKSSTKLKDEYLDDVAVQYHVLTGAGVTVSKAHVAHVNKSYVREGKLDLAGLFTMHDVTDMAKEKQAAVKKEIAAQKRMLAGDIPAIDIGSYCSKPHECEFTGHCWQHIPENSVFDLAGKGINKFALYQKGLVRMADVPLDLLKGKQRQQAELARTKGSVIDKKGLRSFLDQLWYPLCFLDFETFMEAVPSHDSQQPYQQMPFQYSLHYLKRPGGKLYHREYLAEPGVDPRKPLLKQMLADIPGGACILAYWDSFEGNRLKELAEVAPRNRKQVQVLLANMFDLIDPFKERHLYSWKQKGSNSIKAVLPAFVDGMTYEGMEIANGSMAMEAYHRMCELKGNPKELASLRKAQLEYCRQDTLAMVKLLEVVEQTAGK